MSDEAPNEWFVSTDIPFAAGSGYVGLSTTPGSVPIPVASLYFEAETAVHDGEAVESIWLKARPVGADPETGKSEYLMFLTGHERFGALVSVLAEVAMGRTPVGGNRVSGTFDGYHDSNQVAASDAVSEECIDGLRADVRRGQNARGFDLALRTDEQAKAYDNWSKSFSTGGRDQAVMRLVGNLAPEAVTSLLSEYGRLRDWQEGMRTKVAAYVRDNPSSPAPGR